MEMTPENNSFGGERTVRQNQKINEHILLVEHQLFLSNLQQYSNLFDSLLTYS